MSKIPIVIKPKPLITVTDDYYNYHITLGYITTLGGKRLGFNSGNGYVQYRDHGKKYYVHRKIFEMGTGLKIPQDMVIAHKNGDSSDNRFKNFEANFQ